MAVQEVNIHLLPGTQIFLLKEKEPKYWRKRVLVVHYYVDDLVEAKSNVTVEHFRKSYQRFYKELGFRSIVFRVHYLLNVRNKDLLEFKKFDNNQVNGCRFDGNLINRNLYKTSLSRIEFFLERYRVDAKPVRARALGTIVYDPLVKAQGVHYTHELLYYLSEDPQPLTLQEWQCLGHLKRGHDSNFITFVFKVWPTEQGANVMTVQRQIRTFNAVFRNTIRGEEARAMAAAVGFQIREHVAYIYRLGRKHFPKFGKMFKSLHDLNDIVTPPFRPNRYRGRHPELRLEHHHVYHVYPLPSEPSEQIGPLHVLDFPETNPLFAPHLKVVLHLFYHYPPHLVNGFGRQDVETLRQFMFDARPVDGINRKYHQVVIHPVMYSRPIRSFLQSPGVSLVNIMAYPEEVQVAKFKTKPKELPRVTLYIYPGTRVVCPFPEKPLRKSRERHLYLVYFVSDLKQCRNSLKSTAFQVQLGNNYRKMDFSKIHVSITYMCRPYPEVLTFAPHDPDFPFVFEEWTEGPGIDGMTHISSTTFSEMKRKPDGNRSGLFASATGEGFSDPLEGLEGTRYFQDCLVHLIDPPSAQTLAEWNGLTRLEWEALRTLRAALRADARLSRVTLVFKKFCNFFVKTEVMKRIKGPTARALAEEHGFEILPHLAYTLSNRDNKRQSAQFRCVTECVFNSMQTYHINHIPPLNRTGPDYNDRLEEDLIEFHYSYHMYPGVDGNMAALNASRLPFRRVVSPERNLRFLHLFYYCLRGFRPDLNFEQATIAGLQQYIVNAAMPVNKYHYVEMHQVHYLTNLDPPPTPPVFLSPHQEEEEEEEEEE